MPSVFLKYNEIKIIDMSKYIKTFGDIVENPYNMFECNITFEPFESTTLVFNLPCNHIFLYTPEIDYSISRTKICPYCRSIIT